ncbi:hypothetical protein SORBI_3005G023301, partial [Sorghum bicolor]
SVDEAERKRQERNRKQREYRARRKAEESEEIRQERNKRRRDERLFNRTKILTNNNTQGANHGILHASSAQDKENATLYWMQVRQLQVPSCFFIIFNMYSTFGNSNIKKALAQRERYNNMDDNSKEILLQKKREYSRNMRSHSAGKQAAQPLIEHSDIEFDSALFEPTNNESDDDDEHLEAPHVLDIDDLLADDEARQYLGEDGAFESYRVTGNGVDLNNNEDPYDYVYHNLPNKHHVLRKVPNCLYCGAMRFQYESPGFCCRKGKIKVHVPQVPDELKRLFTSQVDNDAKYFRQNIRYFNSHFSFTSLGVTLDRRVATAAGTGIYTFRVHGALYHRLDHLVPGSKGARHLQLYFYDTEDDSLAHRKKRSPDLDINLIRNVLRIMEGNPYVQTFNRIGAIPNLDDYVIELNTNVTPDQRRYNAPTASQVAAIWSDGNDPQRCSDRSVLVYARGDRPRYIKAYHGCYDPLAYPLLNPKGEK